MTAYVSNQAGSYYTASNFTPNGFPGIGDTVTINHAMFSGGGIIIGTSPAAGTAVLTIGSGGSLVISGAGTTLSIRGDTLLDNGFITMNAGTILEIDGSASSVAYKFHIGAAHNQVNARLNLNGTSGAHVIVRSNASGPNGTIDDGTGPWLNGGQVTATFADYLRIGSASLPVLFSVNSGGVMSMTDCTFTSGGKWTSTYNISVDSLVYKFQRCSWITTLATETLRTTGASNYTSGIRLFDGCVFDKLVEFYTGDGFTIINNVFNNFDCTNASWASFIGNLVWKSVATDTILAGNISNNVWLINGASIVNPHFTQVGNFSRSLTSSGDIYQFNGSDAQGDCLLTPTANPSSLITITVRNQICLKSSGSNNNSGTPMTFFGSQPNVKVDYQNGTFFIGAQGFVASETGSGTANSLTFFSNLGYDDVSARGYLCQSTTSLGTLDLLPGAQADYNNVYQGLAGSNLKGFNNMQFSVAPGAHNKFVDPQFRDATVNVEKWDLSLGGSGTMTSAINRIIAGTATISSLRNFIINGMTPLNGALKGAGYLGVDIGAISLGGINYTTVGLIKAGIVPSIANVLATPGFTAEMLNKVGVPGVLATKLASGTYTIAELIDLGVPADKGKYLVSGV